MFISNDEKKYLFDQIKTLTTVLDTLKKMESRVIFWEAKVRALEGKVDTIQQIAASKPKKPKTLAQKAKQREYMRKYVARKKAEKLALEQK
jgi:dephospho-CoA kinase